MGAFVIRDALVLLGEKDVSGVLSSVTFNMSNEIQDATTLGASARRRKPGLNDFTAEQSGFYDPEVVGPLFDKLGVIEKLPYTVVPKEVTVGEISFFTQVAQAQYSPGGTLGELTPINLSVEGNDYVVRGRLVVFSTLTSGGNSAAYELGEVPAGKHLYASLHVTEVGGTNPELTVTIQSAATGGFGSPTTQITFPTVEEPSSHFLSTPGPISDEFFRALWTTSGTDEEFLAVISIGIR